MATICMGRELSVLPRLREHSPCCSFPWGHQSSQTCITVPQGEQSSTAASPGQVSAAHTPQTHAARCQDSPQPHLRVHQPAMVERDIEEVENYALRCVLEVGDTCEPYVHVQACRELGEDHHGVVDVLQGETTGPAQDTGWAPRTLPPSPSPPDMHVKADKIPREIAVPFCQLGDTWHSTTRVSLETHRKSQMDPFPHPTSLLTCWKFSCSPSDFSWGLMDRMQSPWKEQMRLLSLGHRALLPEVGGPSTRPNSAQSQQSLDPHQDSLAPWFLPSQPNKGLAYSSSSSTHQGNIPLRATHGECDQGRSAEVSAGGRDGPRGGAADGKSHPLPVPGACRASRAATTPPSCSLLTQMCHQLI